MPHSPCESLSLGSDETARCESSPLDDGTGGGGGTVKTEFGRFGEVITAAKRSRSCREEVRRHRYADSRYHSKADNRAGTAGIGEASAVGREKLLEQHEDILEAPEPTCVVGGLARCHSASAVTHSSLLFSAAGVLGLAGERTCSLENTPFNGELREREAKVRRLFDSNIKAFSPGTWMAGSSTPTKPS